MKTRRDGHGVSLQDWSLFKTGLLYANLRRRLAIIIACHPHPRRDPVRRIEHRFKSEEPPPASGQLCQETIMLEKRRKVNAAAPESFLARRLQRASFLTQ